VLLLLLLLLLKRVDYLEQRGAANAHAALIFARYDVARRIGNRKLFVCK
jgi:hypothetical protein